MMVIIYGLRHALSSTSDYFSHFSHFSVQEPSQLLQSLLVNPIGDPVVSSMWLGIIYIVTSVFSLPLYTPRQSGMPAERGDWDICLKYTHVCPSLHTTEVSCRDVAKSQSPRQGRIRSRGNQDCCQSYQVDRHCDLQRWHQRLCPLL